VQDVKRLEEMVLYCAGKIDVLLAPVLIPGLNDDQLDALISLSKRIKNRSWPAIGVQNFLVYPGGRNPGVKERSWDEFFKILQEKEQEHKVNLTLKGCKEVFDIHPEATLPKPFNKNEVISVRLAARGRNKKEFLGVASDRVRILRRSLRFP
jgi:uncharacterized Fe-S cluster-containing radical SAM superfamily enzyme